jgi:glyoxylase-like metal-dependent hydrolase (beta-lactamase superfamily II)
MTLVSSFACGSPVAAGRQPRRAAVEAHSSSLAGGSQLAQTGQWCARNRKTGAREIFMLRTGIAVAATTLWLAGTAIAQQAPPAVAPPPPDFSKVEIKTTDLGDNMYMLEGQGGNITVAVARDGIIMVDSEFAALHDKIKAAISIVSNQPIKYLINTHFHGDHTGGNEPFAKDGVTVVAEANVKTRLAAGTTNGLTGVKTPPAPQGALPSKTYTGAFKIRLPGRVADLKHIANAHTDGDTYVWFKTANVLSTGDTFTNGRYPNIDFANGGNIKGMIAATDAYLKLVNAKTRIVPGHGPVADKAMLGEYHAMLVTARDRMAKLVKEGKSEDDVVAAKPFADLDAKWAPTELASKNFIRVVYHSLADKQDSERPSFRKLFRRS